MTQMSLESVKTFGRNFEKDSQNGIILKREGIKTLIYLLLRLRTKYVDFKFHDDW